MIANFAKLNSENKVIDLFVVDQSDVDANGGDQSIAVENWIKTNLLKDDNIIIKQYSLDSSFRKNEAEIGGGYYDAVNDVFITIKPFPSWSLNSDFKWEAPVTKPAIYTDPLVPDYGFSPYWDEENQKWCVYNINGEIISWNPNTFVWE